MPQDVGYSESKDGKSFATDQKPAEDVSQIYSPEMKGYLTTLQTRLETAKIQKNQVWPEFKGRNIYQYFDDNEKIANTHLPAKKNEDDVIVSAGTVEQKLDAVLSNIANLNLSPEVLAYDEENAQIVELGEALEDIIYDTERRDGGDGVGDKEKKLSRQRELLKQGTVFVQEEWLRKFEIKKKLKEKYNGQFKDFPADGWSESLELVFEGPSRTLLYGPNVFLGDMTEFYMENQPYIFVVIRQDYEIAKTRYGKFENWKYVQKGKIPSTSTNSTDQGLTIYENRWRLTELKDNQVEIILYQDQPNDEFQIIINGVCMLPLKFPLSAVAPMGKYNIAKQVFKIIHDKFAYGGSFVGSGSVKEISALIDEMLKLFVLKERKSFTPAYINTSGRVIDKKVLSPGRISMGIEPGSLTPIAGNEVQGITAGEVGVLQKFEELLNKNTVSDQFVGQPGKSGTTATEVVQLQQQAKLTLGLTISSCSFLEEKLAYLRLWNILQNWFSPKDTKVDEAREIVKTFRSTSRDVNMDGRGYGERRVIATDGELPAAEEIRAEENAEEDRLGKPVKKVYINGKELLNAKLLWFITIIPKEQESSAVMKLMFREQLTDLAMLMKLGSRPNLDQLEEDYARIYRKSRSKIFQAATPQVQQMGGVTGAAGEAPGEDVSDQIMQMQGVANQAGTPNLKDAMAVPS